MANPPSRSPPVRRLRGPRNRRSGSLCGRCNRARPRSSRGDYAKSSTEAKQPEKRGRERESGRGRERESERLNHLSVPPSLRLSVSPSLRLSVSLSLCLPVSLSPALPLSRSLLSLPYSKGHLIAGNAIPGKNERVWARSDARWKDQVELVEAG